MSFAKSFDGMVRDFCRVLSEKYELKEDEVLSVWTGTVNQSAPVKSSSTAPTSSSASTSADVDADTEITKEKIMSATKDMLAAMCKKKGLKQSGKKEELFKRLVDSLSSSTTESTSVKKPVVSASKKEDAPIIKSIKERTAELAIRKNKFGNFEHVPTGLIFNTDKMVYGKQLADGTVLELTSIDIDTCNKYKFPFKMPENLNTSNKNMDDVKIEEMEEELLDEEDIEEDVEEEEDIDEEDA
jgi:hypothetical protein